MVEARPPSVAEVTGPLAVEAEGPEQAGALATDVARAVRELRTNAGLSERAAARILGTSQTQLRRMEDPRYLPSLRSLARVAAAYGHRLRIEFEPRAAPAAPPRVTTGGTKAAPPTKPARTARPKPIPKRAASRGARSRARRRG